MNRNEAVSKSRIKANVFSMDTYRKLKAAYRLPDGEAVGKKTYKAKGKLKTDKERVAEIQKHNNNYKDRR